ncbi:hypothetical protein [Vibrio owensii]|uniref:hypothetical protein n=1 Tax=Vibrio harveyi group TaxID=717610 RepID=UPI003CC6572F
MELINTKQLDFSGGVGGLNQVLTVSPTEHNAAIMEISHGEPNAWIILKVVEGTTNLSLIGANHERDVVRVNKITFGGSVNSSGKARLDSNGQLKNIRIGGSVMVSSKNKDNLYFYSPTISAEYL